MYCEILSDKVIDISMFIKEKCVSENCNYIYSVDFNSNEYSSRWLRKRFFDHELVAFADICKLRSNGMPVPLLRNGYSIFNGTKYR